MGRIGLIGENSIAYISRIINIWNEENSVVLIDWRIPADSAVSILQEAGVEYCWVDSRYQERFTEQHRERINFRTYDVMESLPGLLPKWVYEAYVPRYTRKEAVVLYSSGTTGKSKGIILSHYAIHTNADAIIEYMKPEKEDCIYLVKSLAHSSTLVGELLVALKTGIRLLVSNTVVPPRVVFRNIQTFQVSILCVNPTILRMYMEEAERLGISLLSLRIIYVSGAVLTDTLCKQARDIFRNVEVWNLYGLTEAGPRVSAQRTGCCHGNSVGKPIEGVQIIVVRETGVPVVGSEKGIVHVNTQSQCDGYVTGEEKHASLWKDWLNTGDIGYLDELGELHISGRVDDMILIDAHKIYPAEVERHIEHLLGVKECVVIGISSEQRTILGCLYAGEQKIGLKEKKKLSKVLAPYETPNCYARCEEIPKTNNGKISRGQALRILLQKLEKEKENNDGRN